MLDLIAEAPTPHEWLLSPNFELLFNTDNPHGNSQKTTALRRLHQYGLIDRNSANVWRLTEQGGKMWEKLAQPDWDNFAEYAVEYGSECEYFHVYAATRPLFDRLLRRLPLAARSMAHRNPALLAADRVLLENPDARLPRTGRNRHRTI